MSDPRLYTYGPLFTAMKAAIRQLPKNEIKKVLDAPAGAGALTKFLKEEMKYDVKATDIDTGKWQYEPVELVQADLGRKLPFADNEFDMVICQEGLKHVTDAATAMNELSRVLRPGGWLIVTLPNDLCMQSRLRYFFDGFVDTDRKHRQEVGSEDDKTFLYVSSSIQLPLLYYFIEKSGLQYLFSKASRLRPRSVFMAALLYPLISWRTAKAVGRWHPLYKELMSMTWLAGRHVLTVCRKR